MRSRVIRQVERIAATTTHQTGNGAGQQVSVYTRIGFNVYLNKQLSCSRPQASCKKWFLFDSSFVGFWAALVVTEVVQIAATSPF